jgi:hypothetical protein
MSGSEVAQFRERQRLEEESAQLALSGMAAVASHEAIIARMELGGAELLQMFQNGQGQEAYALWQGGYFDEVQL